MTSASPGRAIALAELLRAGWSAQAVAAAVKVADAGGDPAAAVAAMQAVDRPGQS